MRAVSELLRAQLTDTREECERLRQKAERLALPPPAPPVPLPPRRRRQTYAGTRRSFLPTLDWRRHTTAAIFIFDKRSTEWPPNDVSHSHQPRIRRMKDADDWNIILETVDALFCSLADGSPAAQG